MRHTNPRILPPSTCKAAKSSSCADFRSELAAHDLVASMSKGNSYDNASRESFRSILKNELIQRQRFRRQSRSPKRDLRQNRKLHRTARQHSAIKPRSTTNSSSINHQRSRSSCVRIIWGITWLIASILQSNQTAHILSWLLCLITQGNHKVEVQFKLLY